MIIEDGGSTSRKATVSAAKRLNVSSKTQPRAFYVSRDEGRAYNAVFEDMTCAAGDTVAYAKNNSSDRLLIIDSIEFHSAENVKWKVFSVTGTAASGETIVASNLNLQSGIPADGTYMAGNTAITGLANVRQVGSHRSQALSDSSMDFSGALILGPGDAIAVEYDIGTTGTCSIDMIHHYETIGAT